MLPSIPSVLLKDSMTLFVPTGMDAWQKKNSDTYTVTRVHLQNSNETRKTTDNTEVLLRSLLFVDARRSTPQLDYWALQTAAQTSGDTMRAKVYDASGALQGDYAVLTVDAVPDVPSGKIHHWELGLV